MCPTCISDRLADLLPEQPVMIPFAWLTYYADGGEDFRSPTFAGEVRLEGRSAVRVVLGRDENAPDIHVERQPDGWHVSFHAEANEDVGAILISDRGDFVVIHGNESGRSFVSRTDRAFGAPGAEG
jgi:hypothetical protein